MGLLFTNHSRKAIPLICEGRSIVGIRDFHQPQSETEYPDSESALKTRSFHMTTGIILYPFREYSDFLSLRFEIKFRMSERRFQIFLLKKMRKGRKRLKVLTFFLSFVLT